MTCSRAACPSTSSLQFRSLPLHHCAIRHRCASPAHRPPRLPSPVPGDPDCLQLRVSPELCPDCRMSRFCSQDARTLLQISLLLRALLGDQAHSLSVPSRLLLPRTPVCTYVSGCWPYLPRPLTAGEQDGVTVRGGSGVGQKGEKELSGKKCQYFKIFSHCIILHLQKRSSLKESTAVTFISQAKP